MLAPASLLVVEEDTTLLVKIIAAHLQQLTSASYFNYPRERKRIKHQQSTGYSNPCFGCPVQPIFEIIKFCTPVQWLLCVALLDYPTDLDVIINKWVYVPCTFIRVCLFTQSPQRYTNFVGS